MQSSRKENKFIFRPLEVTTTEEKYVVQRMKEQHWHKKLDPVIKKHLSKVA